MKSKLCKTVFIIEICGLKETLDAVKNPPAMQETRIQSLDQEDPLEKGMATHSSILAWRIPRTEEPGGLQFIGSQRLGYDWVTYTCIHTRTHTHTHTHTHIRIILNLSIHMEHFRWYERKRFHFFLQWYTLPRMLLPACLLLCSLAGQSHSLHKIFQMAGACKTYEINCITSHTHTHTHTHGCVFSQVLCDGRHCHRSQR